MKTIARLCLLWICVTGLESYGSAQARPNYKTVEWQSIRGVNFFPSYASNAHEAWSRFDAIVVDRELGWARGLGFNSVRVWLSVAAFEKAPSDFNRHLRQFMDLCRKHRLTVMLVLFDCCGIEPRTDAVPATVYQVYRQFLQDSRLTTAERELVKTRYQQFAEGRGREMWVDVGPDSPFDILFWQTWSPNPGLRRLQSKEGWPDLERYVESILELGTQEPLVIAFDMMNEPGCLFDFPPGMNRTSAETTVRDFVRHMSHYARSKYPTAVLTIGSQSISQMKALADETTILSFHTYERGAELKSELAEATAFAQSQNKPVLLTECLANTDNWLKTHGEESLSSDDGQLRHYQETLPVIQRSRIGWYSWGFIAGRMFTPFTDILYPNGYRRPAAVYLEWQLRQE
jgi:hypothetical protein